MLGRIVPLSVQNFGVIGILPLMASHAKLEVNFRNQPFCAQIPIHTSVLRGS